MRKTKLSVCVALASGLGSGLALAQQDPTSGDKEGMVLEEIVVTGFRQSLEAARDIKRDSANMTDNIVAEDIGKMPDLNLAESLQRVPGVSITREGGEGRNITVRGLGPDFTRVTLNGMEVPSGTGGLDSSGGINRGRSFDFNVFGSELFNKITINKSGVAHIEEGGLASTVELYSHKPLDNPGQKILLSGQGSYNLDTEELDPRLVALYSNTFMDDTIGVLVSYTQSDRTVHQDGFGTVRYTSPFSNGRSWAGTDADTIINGTPNPQANYPGEAIDPTQQLDYLWHPRLPRMDSFNREQERSGYVASFQYRPVDTMTFSLDVVGSELDADVESYNYFAQFRNLQDSITPREVTLDNAGRVITAGTFDNVQPRSESRGQFSETSFLQTVVSGQFLLRDNMTLDVMYGNATSDHDEDQYRFNITAKEGHPFSYSFEDDSDVAEMSYGFDILDPANYDWSGPTLRRDRVERDNDTFKMDLEITSDTSLVRTGLIWNNRQVQSKRFNPININPDLAPVSADNTRRASQVLDDFGAALDSPSGFPKDWLVSDFGASIREYNAGQFEFVPDDSNTFDVEEETLGGYVEAEFDTELLGRPFTANVGLRVVKTELTSRGVSSDGLGGFIPTTFEQDYTEYLPSTNLVWEFYDNVLLRLAMGRNLSRPGLGSLAGSVDVTPINQNVSIGNPDLEPLRADSVDLGVEWYFNDTGLLSLTFFRKEIDSFITGETLESQSLPSDVRNVVAALPQYNPDSPLFDPSLISPDSDDWNISTSVNGEGADLDGYEIGYQQNFDFLPIQGFGAFANYTHVESEAEFGNGIVGSLEGLSEDSYNVGVYYENDLFGLRFVVNDRDDYITDQTGSNGNAQHGTTGPTRLDMSAYWNITDYLQLTLEGYNLTNEEERLYTTGPTGDMDLIREFNSTGTEILLGLRATF
ncbi:TonB-dependent receptor [Parahaliea maris]|nr:TonB-dependent receptor [Parahaliea maris]